MTDETSGLREVVETLLALRGECQKHSGDWRGDSVTIAHLDQAILVLRARPALSDETLRTFACEVLDGYRTGVVGDIDGGWLQDRAIALGLLVERGGEEDDPNYYLAPVLIEPAQPVSLSDKTLREMALDHLYVIENLEDLVEFARAVLARQQEQP